MERSDVGVGEGLALGRHCGGACTPDACSMNSVFARARGHGRPPCPHKHVAALWHPRGGNVAIQCDIVSKGWDENQGPGSVALQCQLRDAMLGDRLSFGAIYHGVMVSHEVVRIMAAKYSNQQPAITYMSLAAKPTYKQAAQVCSK
ncbi:hypothetical protein HaLaN_05267, partial [Haematococcus lacustris]